MPNDPLATINEDPIVRRPPILCEFCESKLTRRGEVLEMSDKAKALRRLQDQIDNLTNKLSERDTEIVRLSGELAAARAELKPAKKSGWFDDDDDDE